MVTVPTRAPSRAPSSTPEANTTSVSTSKFGMVSAYTPVSPTAIMSPAYDSRRDGLACGAILGTLPRWVLLRGSRRLDGCSSRRQRVLGWRGRRENPRLGRHLVSVGHRERLLAGGASHRGRGGWKAARCGVVRWRSPLAT